MKQREQQRIKSNWIYKRQMEKEINVWYSEYEIRQFVDTATRSSIDVIYQNRTKQMPFGIFTNYVENARSNFELFSTELNEKLIKNENWKAIGIDLNSKFLIGINQYIKWHEENKSSLEKFNPYCPYTLMLNVIESTKAEILKYFPELDESNIIENPFNTPYNGMFTTSQTKTRFKLDNGSIQERNIVNNTYDLRDTNIYDHESGELIEIDIQSSYNTSFLLKLGKMYIPNVKPYLTHQLKGSSKPAELIEYVRYCALNSEIIKSNGIKQAINDWLTEQQKPISQTKIVRIQPTTSQKSDLKETLSKQITHVKRAEIAKGIINKYKTFKGVELRILLNALFKLELFPKNRKDALFHRCCVNDFENVGKYQSMEAKTFKRGFKNAKGKYIESDHEKRCNEIVKFLQSIINAK